MSQKSNAKLMEFSLNYSTTFYICFEFVHLFLFLGFILENGEYLESEELDTVCVKLSVFESSGWFFCMTSIQKGSGSRGRGCTDAGAIIRPVYMDLQALSERSKVSKEQRSQVNEVAET